MARITLSGVEIAFPIYHASARSMRRHLVDTAISRVLVRSGARPVVQALRGIDLSLRDGDRLALIGANGAGKTTLLRTMAGIYAPKAGSIARAGRVTPLLGIGMGLNLEATGRENILLLGMHLDVPPAEMRPRIDEIVAWTELGAFIDAPMRTYSAGMVLRLAFAVSTAIPTEILLLDEWLGVGDVDFQQRAYDRMARFVGNASILVLASHSHDLLRGWCNRAIRLDGGEIVAQGSVDDVLNAAPNT